MHTFALPAHTSFLPCAYGWSFQTLPQQSYQQDGPHKEAVAEEEQGVEGEAS